MRIGERVVVTRIIDLSPHTIVEAGETGEVDRIDKDTGEVWIRLDKYHQGLSEWFNSLWLNEYTEDISDAIANVDLLHAA